MTASSPRTCTEDSWSELLAQLVERGLSGVQLVVADAHAGIAAAVRKHLPEAPLQRCTVPPAAERPREGSQRLRGRLGREISKVCRCGEPDRRATPPGGPQGRPGEAGARGHEVPRRRLRSGDPVLRLPAGALAHWYRIRSTNGLERLHGEIKRRTRAVGAFPYRASALRLIGSRLRPVRSGDPPSEAGARMIVFVKRLSFHVSSRASASLP